jgi:hypothetical protein
MQSVSRWMHNTGSLPDAVDMPPRGRFREAARRY